MVGEVGMQQLTASGVVGVSGKPVAICGYSILCGTAAAVHFKVGTSASNAWAIGDMGVANTGKTVSIDNPVVFPIGAYCSFETNVSAVTVFYRQMQTA